MDSVHVPVLCNEVVALLGPAAPGLFVDATIGLAGHASAVLATVPGFRLLGLDRDPDALRAAKERLAPLANRAQLVCSEMADLPTVLARFDEEEPAAILADLGCSSLQLDTPERGFSFIADGPLDMRMGKEGPTAADIVNTSSEEELMRLLWEYGEERRARAIARAVAGRRRQSPLSTTGELSRLVVEVLGARRGARIHPATRTFQALRIAVNDELGQLQRFLEPAARALKPGGRLAVISFHSLEDRIVKHTLRRLQGACVCPPGLPRCVCDRDRVLRVLTKRPLRPTEAETDANPRSRSARLRAAERLAGEG